MSVIITPRSEWGAVPPKEPPRLLFHPIENVVVYPETQTKPCKSKRTCIKTLRKIQRKHMEDRGLPDIKFNFLIGMDGRIYEGTGWFHRGHGTQVSQYPELDQCISICFIGDFGGWIPPNSMKVTATGLIDYGIENNYLTKNYVESFDVFY